MESTTLKYIELCKICVCNPPLRMRSLGDTMFTTYNLDAICPMCKKEFYHCKPELVKANMKTELSMYPIIPKYTLEDLGLDKPITKKKRTIISHLLNLFK
jgi:hypothetical protein